MTVPETCLDFLMLLKLLLCQRDKGSVRGAVCGLLKESASGPRDAAQKWKMEYVQTTTEVGFMQGAHCACVLYREPKYIRVVIRGGDTSSGG